MLFDDIRVNIDPALGWFILFKQLYLVGAWGLRKISIVDLLHVAWLECLDYLTPKGLLGGRLVQ